MKYCSDSSSDDEFDVQIHPLVCSAINIVSQSVAQTSDLIALSSNKCNWSKIPRSDCISITEKFLKLVEDTDNADKFISFYRLDQKEFLWLTSHFHTSKRFRWDIRLQTMIFLDWMASKIHVKQLARIYSVPKSTVQDSLKRIMKEMMKLQKKIIFLPNDPNELKFISQSFYKKSGNRNFLKNIVGAIDGSLVKLIVPEEQLEAYFDRHLNTSINFSCICDHRMLIRFLIIGKTGACHDMNVLKSSSLYQRKLFPPKGYVILGDSAYMNMFEPISIIVPFKKDNSQQLLPEYKSEFNLVHSRVRSVIERTYGDIKNKWRRIHKNILECKIEMAIDTIAAACILNNITLGNYHETDSIPWSNMIDEDYSPETRYNQFSDANSFREAIAIGIQN